MSLLVCFFVLIISFSVPDIQKLNIVARSMRDAFGFQRKVIVTGMVEIDGNPRFEYAKDLVPLVIRERSARCASRARRSRSSAPARPRSSS
ncbi:MAG TPA: flagellar motor protein MotB [Geminicoccaceae bacterium]|nr:flagellar motor protein MotB [Geminicoccaceae bacterium]